MGTAGGLDDEPASRGIAHLLRGVIGTLKRCTNWCRQRIGERLGRHSRLLGTAAFALFGLVLVGWFLISTYPRQMIVDVANLNVTIKAPPGSVPTANAMSEVHLAPDGGAAATVEVYFVCLEATTLTIELASKEAHRVDYSPESPGVRLSNSQLSQPSVNRVDDGVQVSGPCGQNAPVNLPFSVEFPAGTVATPLERGRYAFGIDLFIGNQSAVLSSNSLSIGLRTPKGALLSEAFDAQSRTFNRATWQATTEFNLPAYGTYTVPEQVAQARWWENAVLLLLGAVVGLAVEAGLRRVRPERRAS
jgi:hypothetical protein